jgi:hypothetical protein
MPLRTTWAFATVAEVYTPAACLTVLIWQLMLRPSLANEFTLMDLGLERLENWLTMKFTSRDALRWLVTRRSRSY